MKRYVTALGISLIVAPAIAQWPGESISTTPEPLTINKVTYLVPRNYIYVVYNPYIETLKVTYPDFKPFTEQTQELVAFASFRTSARPALRGEE